MTRGRLAPAVMRAAVLVAAVVSGRCAAGGDAPAVPVIDLLAELPRAEKRPADGAFAIAEHTAAGVRQPGIEAPTPSRLVWTVRFPVRATFRSAVAVLPAGAGDVTVNFRVGVSDERVYEQLAEARVSASRARGAAWVPLPADLSAYAGRKWSLFYRPDSHPWRLVLSADPVAGTGRAFWAAPRVDSDADGAREWRRRASLLPPAGGSPEAVGGSSAFRRKITARAPTPRPWRSTMPTGN